VILIAIFDMKKKLTFSEFRGSLKVTNIFFIRHGESFNNCVYNLVYENLGKDITDEEFLAEEGKLRQVDPDLSPRGYQQSEMLGKYEILLFSIQCN
jgi:hypothetical protein